VQTVRVLFVDVAVASRAVAATTKRSDKVAALAEMLTRAAPDEVPAAVSFGMGETRHGRIGVGWKTIRDVRPVPAPAPVLTVGEVDRAIARLASMSGGGSVGRRRDVVRDLLARSTPPEQDLVRSILGGELRQGALGGVMTAAVAAAAGVRVDEVRRAAMLTGDLGDAARTALTGGIEGLRAIGLTPSRPVQPMLASTATDVASALADTGLASVEWKLDGVRVQVHRAAAEVTVFTRNLNDVTDRLGGVVEAVRALPGGDLVLDGEAIGVDESGAPHLFQDTMGDFGAEPTGKGSGRGSGLQVFFFDVLFAGRPLVDEPLSIRRDVLVGIVGERNRLPSMVTADAAEAQAFLERSLEAGHEGVMVKAVDSTYEAGRRGGAWRKVKPVHTLDLVVIAVEWGHGRRQGMLSNLHLAARAGDGAFVMVGKTFKGLTDDLLRWQTERFLALRIDDGAADVDHVVHVHPEQVVEVAVDGVQRSSRYPGGVALRFARVRRYRHDKTSAEADHIDDVRRLRMG
jgi:DNA ligase-1